MKPSIETINFSLRTKNGSNEIFIQRICVCVCASSLVGTFHHHAHRSYPLWSIIPNISNNSYTTQCIETSLTETERHNNKTTIDKKKNGHSVHTYRWQKKK